MRVSERFKREARREVIRLREENFRSDAAGRIDKEVRGIFDDLADADATLAQALNTAKHLTSMRTLDQQTHHMGMELQQAIQKAEQSVTSGRKIIGRLKKHIRGPKHTMKRR